MIFHEPVLLKEVFEFLNIQPGEKYIDATVGGGGHAAAILGAGGVVLGIDTDPAAVEASRKRLATGFPRPDTKHQIPNTRYQIAQGNFKNIDSIAKEYGFENASGIIFDLGMSSWQIGGSGRGFSFLKDEPLDMRMDLSQAVGARDLLAGLTEKELDELFHKFAEEKRSRAIARTIVRARSLRPIKTTCELAGLLAWVGGLSTAQLRQGYEGRRVSEDESGEFWNWYESTFVKKPTAYGDFGRRARIFQALRIVVNDELNSLKAALPRALKVLKAGGELVVISFHSLEDRIVKDFGRSTKGVTVLTKKPICPSEVEVVRNPRARSARLRAFEKNDD